MMLRRRLLRLALAAPGRLAATTAVALVAHGVGVFQALVTARLLGRLLAGAALAEAVSLLILLVALIALGAALQWLRGRLAMATAAAAKQRFRRRLCAHLLRLGPAYVQGTTSAHLRTVLVDAVEAMEGYIGHYLPQVAVAVVGSGVVLGLLWALDPWVAAVVAGGWLGVLTVPRLWENLLGDYGRAHWHAYGRFQAELLDNLRGMATLVAFGASRRRGLQLYRRGLELYRETLAQSHLAMARAGFAALLTGVGTVLAVGLGVLRATSGALALPDLLAILFLVSWAFQPITALERLWVYGYGGVTAEPYLFGLLDAIPAVEERAEKSAEPLRRESPATAAGPVRTPAGGPPTIAFEEVEMAYPGADGRPALHGLSLTLRGGEIRVLVGPSGAGKSTLVALLLRFFDPTAGRILLAGRDLRRLPLATLRRSIALVSQDAVLFPGTLADNLRFARPGASDGELAAAARAARFDDVVRGRPEGWQARLGEGGAGLSGGERQRLALARAILADAPVLVLDEATAQLDGVNEVGVLDGLREGGGRRTVLVIAHRLSAVRDLGPIAVIDSGRVMEEGTHEALLARGGAYARLWAAQGGDDG
jgi:ABC-type multidrug transport system fused ATPase/permease subunit